MEPEPIGAVLDQAAVGIEHLRGIAAWCAAFICPRHRSEPVPCAVRDLETMAPMVPLPPELSGGELPAWVLCPAFEGEGCGPERAWLARQEVLRHLRWRLEAQELGVPQRFWEATFRGSKRTPALAVTQDWLRTHAPHGRCLALLGETGTGKTHAAVAALEAWEGPRGFLYVPGWVRDLVGENWERKRVAVRAMSFPGLLVLDDLGAEYLKPGGKAAGDLDALFWAREGNRWPTILTANLTPNELQARLSERMRDRLRGDWTAHRACIHLLPPGSLRGRAEEGKP